MNARHMLQAILAAGLIVLGLGMVEKAQAIGPNPDTMVVAVTPGGFQYGVYISSPLLGGTTGYDFGQVSLGATTISTQAIQVVSSGTTSEYFSVGVSNSNPDNWAPVVSPIPSLRQFRMMARFTGNTTQPGDGVFADNLSNSPPVDAMGLYGQSLTDPGNSQYLWLRLTMPSQVPNQNPQTMVITVNGQSK